MQASTLKPWLNCAVVRFAIKPWVKLGWVQTSTLKPWLNLGWVKSSTLVCSPLYPSLGTWVEGGTLIWYRGLGVDAAVYSWYHGLGMDIGVYSWYIGLGWKLNSIADTLG